MRVTQGNTQSLHFRLVRYTILPDQSSQRNTFYRWQCQASFTRARKRAYQVASLPIPELTVESGYHCLVDVKLNFVPLPCWVALREHCDTCVQVYAATDSVPAWFLMDIIGLGKRLFPFPTFCDFPIICSMVQCTYCCCPPVRVKIFPALVLFPLQRMPASESIRGSPQPREGHINLRKGDENIIFQTKNPTHNIKYKVGK